MKRLILSLLRWLAIITFTVLLCAGISLTSFFVWRYQDGAWSALSELDPVEIILLLEGQITPQSTPDEVLSLMADYGVTDCHTSADYVSCETPVRPPSLSRFRENLDVYLADFTHNISFELYHDGDERIVYVNTVAYGASHWIMRVDEDQAYRSGGSRSEPVDFLSACHGQMVRLHRICWSS